MATSDNSIKYNSDELLQFLAESGKIDLQEAATQLEMQNREKVLEEHPFSVTQGKDGRWRTRVIRADGTRKIIAKTSKEDLIDALIEEKKECERDNGKGYTLTSLFKAWCEYKELHNASPTYMKRIKNDWKHYYRGRKISQIPIKDIKLIDCDVFAHKLIKKVNGSRKQYYNVSMIIRQMLDYAVELEIVDRNVFSSLKIKSRMVFKTERKGPSEEQVFTPEEVAAITEAAWNDFHSGYNTVHKLVPLAVLFQFQTGLRAGELCAVRYEDITGNKMYVRRMYRYSVHEVVEFTKGNNPGRIVPLTSDALNIIKTAKDYQHDNGLPEDGYIFSVNKNPFSYYALKKIYEKYSLEICGIIKSSHKVRKTFISALLDGGVNLDKVREIVGHADEKTTLNAYCYDRRDLDENIELMENALSDHKKTENEQ